MRPITATAFAAALLGSASLLPATSWAQTTTAASASAPATRQAQVEQRIADMHATLHITPAEDPAFNSFAQVMLDNAQAMDAVATKNEGDPSTRNAVQTLQQYASVTEQHAQNVQKLSAAFGTLYATLSPAQQKTADEMFRNAAADRQARKDQKAGG
jgi:sorbitol-specific phosphotransferase system component IIBC